MTCLVALRHARGWILGADAAMVAGSVHTHGIKIHRRGTVWLACAGSVRATGAFLDRCIHRSRPKDLARWLRSKRPPGEGFAWSAGTLLEWGSEISEVIDYSTSGSGWEIALGALHALRSQGSSPASAVVGSLRAAAAHRGDVCAPFSLLSLPAGVVRTYR